MSYISSYTSFHYCECQNKGAKARYSSDEEQKAQETIELVSLKPEVKYLTYSEIEYEMLMITLMKLILFILSP